MRAWSTTVGAFSFRDAIARTTIFLYKKCDTVCCPRRAPWRTVRGGRIRASPNSVNIAVAHATHGGAPDSGGGRWKHSWDETEGREVERVQIPEGAELVGDGGAAACESALGRRLQSLRFNYEGVGACRRVSSARSGGCIRYRCHYGHIVRCLANSLAARYCPSCSVTHAARGSKRKLSLFELRQTACENGGALVSTEYVNARTPLTWRCGQGHIWRTSACNVRNGRTWCPECARQRRKLGLGDMHRLAARFGGECVSDQYISQHVKLQWRCGRGHTFWLAPNNVARSPGGKRKPTWCKICRRMDGGREGGRIARGGRSERTEVMTSKRARSDVSSRRSKSAVGNKVNNTKTLKC